MTRYWSIITLEHQVQGRLALQSMLSIEAAER